MPLSELKLEGMTSKKGWDSVPKVRIFGTEGIGKFAKMTVVGSQMCRDPRKILVTQ